MANVDSKCTDIDTDGVYDVLIVGAGPTGLTAACEAIRNGLSVRIVDSGEHRSIYSKALVMHARTLEILRSLDQSNHSSNSPSAQTTMLYEEMISSGTQFVAMNIFNSRQTFDPHTKRLKPPSARVNFSELEWGDTEFPYWLSIPQYETERLLEEHLKNHLGTLVDWGNGLANVPFGISNTNKANISATLVDGQVVTTKWIIGCDGGRSLTAKLCGDLKMERTSLGATFILADVKTTCQALLDVQNEGRIFRGSSEGVLILVPMVEPSVFRIIAHVRDTDRGANVRSVEDVTAEYLDRLIKERTGILNFGAYDISWTSSFQLSQGVRNMYRSAQYPCVFLAGDAGHVHSPVGGQGMNTGIHDAHNLMWKIATATRLQGAGKRALAERYLQSYQIERKPQAMTMVEQTSKATKALLARRNSFFRCVVNCCLPRILQAKKNMLARPIGMLNIAYRKSSLFEGGASGGANQMIGERVPNPWWEFEEEVERGTLKEGKEKSAPRRSKVHLHEVCLRSNCRSHSLLEFRAGDERGNTSDSVVVHTLATLEAVCSVKVGQPASTGLRLQFKIQPSRSAVILIRPDLVCNGCWSNAAQMLESELFQDEEENETAPAAAPEERRKAIAQLLRVPLPPGTYDQ